MKNIIWREMDLGGSNLRFFGLLSSFVFWVRFSSFSDVTLLRAWRKRFDSNLICPFLTLSTHLSFDFDWILSKFEPTINSTPKSLPLFFLHQWMKHLNEEKNLTLEHVPRNIFQLAFLHYISWQLISFALKTHKFHSFWKFCCRAHRFIVSAGDRDDKCTGTERGFIATGR